MYNEIKQWHGCTNGDSPKSEIFGPKQQKFPFNSFHSREKKNQWIMIFIQIFAVLAHGASHPSAALGKELRAHH